VSLRVDIADCESTSGTYGIATTGGAHISLQLHIYNVTVVECTGPVIVLNGTNSTTPQTGASLSITESTFMGNRNGVIQLTDAASSVVHITGTTFLSNGDTQATIGAVVLSTATSNRTADPMIDFVNCTFRSNRGWMGGVLGIQGSNGNIRFEDCEFTNNSATMVGVLAFTSAGFPLVSIRNSKLKRNRAEVGGVFFVNQIEPLPALVFRSVEITDNYAQQSGGLGFYGNLTFSWLHPNYPPLSLSNSTVYDNRAGAYGPYLAAAPYGLSLPQFPAISPRSIFPNSSFDIVVELVDIFGSAVSLPLVSGYVPSLECQCVILSEQKAPHFSPSAGATQITEITVGAPAMRPFNVTVCVAPALPQLCVIRTLVIEGHCGLDFEAVESPSTGFVSCSQCSPSRYNLQSVGACQVQCVAMHGKHFLVFLLEPNRSVRGVLVVLRDTMVVTMPIHSWILAELLDESCGSVSLSVYKLHATIHLCDDAIER